MKDLQKLYKESLNELKQIGIDTSSIEKETDIKISKRNNKRYGCCRQEEPDKSTKVVTYIGRNKSKSENGIRNRSGKRLKSGTGNGKRKIEYLKFNIHHIEISPWVMELDDKIIKNTIIHEIIHCFPGCNNHGEIFKKYAKYINENLGYNISRVGNREEDYKKSNIAYSEKDKARDRKVNYKIICQNCGQTFFRQRLAKNFKRAYRCGICKGKFEIERV